MLSQRLARSFPDLRILLAQANMKISAEDFIADCLKKSTMVTLGLNIALALVLLKSEKSLDDTNPFSALFSFAKPAEKSKSDKDKEKEELKKLKEKGIKPDTFAEKYLRNLAEANSFGEGFNIYDFYKKGHGMASVPYGGDKGDAKLKLKAPMTALGKFFRTER